MYWRDILTLISVEKIADSAGYKELLETRRDVFADAQSTKRSEFYEAKRSGEKLAATFLVRAVDYHGEELAEWNGIRYKVIRHYTKSGEIFELNCSEIPVKEEA